MLQDVVVVELGERISVAHCGKLLTDLGATVIAVRSGPVDGSPERTAYLDAGKRAVLVPPGEPLDAQLCRRVDIVVHDGGDGTAERLSQLREGHPDVVVVALSDYGLTGPDAGTPATEFTLQAEAGITMLHPTHDRPPVGTGVDLVELTASIEAACAAVHGLLAVDAGAQGVEFDVSRFESGVALMLYPWLNGRIEGHSPVLSPMSLAPGVEEAADGWVCVVAITADQWDSLKKMIGDPALDDPRFDTAPGRIGNSAVLTPLLRAYTRQHTVAELVEFGAEHRVPIMPIGTPTSLPQLPPYRDRGTYVRNEHGGFRQPRPPFRWTPAAGTGQAGASWLPEPAPVAAESAGLLPERTPARQVSATATPAAPLAGVRVLELGLFHAGPLVSCHLAALGADVIKVESVSRPDLVRLLGVPATTDRFWERSAAFVAPNVGKRDITADLGTAEGLEIVRRLVATSDVVVENYAPRTLDARGLGYDGLRAIKPDLLVVRMPAWGLDGPWRDRPGFTYTADGTSGMAELTGYPDGPPLLTGTVIDPVAGLVGALSVLAGLHRRGRTGEGGLVELALCDVATLLTADAVITASRPAGAHVRARAGNRSPHAAPQGTYRAADGTWVAVSVATDAQWAGLASLPGVADWAGDPDLATADGRQVRLDDLDAGLAKLCAAEPAARVVEALRAAGVPAAPVALGDDLTAHRQIVARERVVTVDHPVLGPLPYIGSAARPSTAPRATAPRPCPLFGEHNAEVLTELGYSAAEIDDLVARKVIGRSPFGLPVKG